MVRENLQEVEEKIAEACSRAGRDREEVTLIAVSKTKPVAMIEEAVDSGIISFGENKVQELVRKRESLPEDIRWHYQEKGIMSRLSNWWNIIFRYLKAS